MKDLYEGIRAEFAEAQNKVECRSTNALSGDNQTEAPSDKLPPPFKKTVKMRKSKSVSKPPIEVVSDIVPIPDLHFECPRRCGMTLTLKAGMTLAQAMGGHSCRNASGHAAYLEEQKIIAEARDRGWRLAVVTSVSNDRNEMTVRFTDGTTMRTFAGTSARGERLWMKHLDEGDVLPGCKDTKATKEMWVVERADK